MAGNQQSSSSLRSYSFSSASEYGFSSIARVFNCSPIKLDSNNYLFWKAQILATIRAFNLISFINKSEKTPVKYLPDPDSGDPNAQKVNEEHLAWLKSD